MEIWELRFNDGRGASLYTDEDVTAEIGQAGCLRSFRVAARVAQGSALSDAIACFERGDVRQVTAHMGAIAFTIRHAGDHAPTN